MAAPSFPPPTVVLNKSEPGPLLFTSCCEWLPECLQSNPCTAHMQLLLPLPPRPPTSPCHTDTAEQLLDIQSREG